MKLITNPDEVEPQAFNIAAAARYLGLSEKQTRTLVKSGKIRSRNTGKAYIIARSALEEYLAGSDEPIRHPESA